MPIIGFTQLKRLALKGFKHDIVICHGRITISFISKHLNLCFFYYTSRNFKNNPPNLDTLNITVARFNDITIRKRECHIDWKTK